MINVKKCVDLILLYLFYFCGRVYMQVSNSTKENNFSSIKASEEQYKYSNIMFDYQIYANEASDQHLINQNLKKVNYDTYDKNNSINVYSNEKNMTIIEGTYNNYNISKIDLIRDMKFQDLIRAPYFNKAVEIFQLGDHINVKINTNAERIIYIDRKNSQYGNSLNEITNIYFRDTLLEEGREYYKNFSISNDSFYSNEFKSSYNNSIDYKAYCKEQSFPNTINGRWYRDYFKHIVQFRINSFGLVEGVKGVFYFMYNPNDGTFEYFSLDKILNITASSIRTEDEEYSKMWILDGQYDKTPFLVLLTKNFKRLFFLELITDEFGLLISLYRKYELDPEFFLNESTDVISVSAIYVNRPNLDDPKTFSEINFITIGTDRGLFFLKKFEPIYDSGSPYLNIGNNYLITRQNEIVGYLESFYYRNFGLIPVKHFTQYDVITQYGDSSINKVFPDQILQIKGYTLVLARGFGMVCYQYNNEFQQCDANHYRIPNLKHIDLNINPLNNIHYIGLFSENKDYFFTELIEEKGLFILNKVIKSTSEIKFSNVVSPDMYLSYVFNKIDSSLIIIRRGMINKINYKTVKIKFHIDINGLDTKLINIYNKKTELNHVGIVVNGLINTSLNEGTSSNLFINIDKNNTSMIEVSQIYNFLYFLDVFSYSPNSIICKFDTEGTYNITISSLSESCPMSINQNYAYTFCNIINFIEIEAIGPDMSSLAKLGIILGSSIGFLILLIFIFLLFKTQCCTDFTLFNKGKTPIPTREELYLDNWETTKKRRYIDNSLSNSNDQNASQIKIIRRNSNSLGNSTDQSGSKYPNNYIRDVDKDEVIYDKLEKLTK